MDGDDGGPRPRRVKSRVFAALIGALLPAPAPAQNAAALMQRETHGAVEVLSQGEGAARVYLFIPVQPAPRGRVPLVLFHHGWQGMNPKNFGALVDHLAREGNVVVYPVYQESAATSPQTILASAAAADRTALAMLHARHLAPDPRHVLYIGYSMGAAISLDIALVPQKYGLPAPDALLLMAPGDAPAVASGPAGRPIIGDLTKLPHRLPVILMAGAQDTGIGLPTATAIYARICAANPNHRAFFILPPQVHAGATINANHYAPGAPDPRYDFPLTSPPPHTNLQGQRNFPESPSLNQLDFNGFWKLADALATNPATALQQPHLTALGTWPDGTPLTPMLRVGCGK
jgi:dienelactone hydrolase